MSTSAKPNCTQCEWIHGKGHPCYDGRMYQFKDYPNWYVNQYGAEEGFLGWLSLQPIDCVAQISDLQNRETLEQMGPVIKTLQKALFDRWSEVFPGDELERIHTASFMETDFDILDDPSENRKYFHVHFHIIPRSIAIGRLIRRHVNGAKQYVAWDDYTIAGHMRSRCDFQCYLPNNGNVARFFSLLNQDKFLNVVPLVQGQT